MNSKTKFSYLTHLANKFKYSGLLRLMLDGLGRCHITVMPFILFREDISLQPVGVPEFIEDDYEFVHLNCEDMDEIATIPHRNRSSAYLKDLLEDGKLCLALKHQGQLVAFTWCNLDECTFEGARFRLKDDEAYLFDMFTNQQYRGKGIAPYLRYQLYRELRDLGRVKLYSVSSYLNKPAMRFKEKLGANKLTTGIHIDLFHLKKFSAIIWRYEPY